MKTCPRKFYTITHKVGVAQRVTEHEVPCTKDNCALWIKNWTESGGACSTLILAEMAIVDTRPKR